MNDHQPSPLSASMQKLLNRRNLIASAGVGAAAVAFGRSVVGKDDGRDLEKDKEHDDKSHGDDHDEDVQPAGTVPAGSAEVRIDDDDADGFEPRTITIDLGESITWVNVDKDPHTATGASFDTGRIEPGDQATVTFDEAGSFPYFCSYHPIMTGTVEVRDENGNVPASPQASPGASPQASPAAGQQAAVSIDTLAFDPVELEVSAGTTVVWTNIKPVPHTVTSSDELFSSETLQLNDTFSHRFTTAGTFEYFCDIHPSMQATIVVTERAR